MVIDWEPIGDNFWSDDLKAAKLEAARLFKEPWVVIINPPSLAVGSVSAVLDHIEECYGNTRSNVMILTPFKTLEARASLRRLVEARAGSFATLFYQPPVRPPRPSRTSAPASATWWTCAGSSGAPKPQ